MIGSPLLDRIKMRAREANAADSIAALTALICIEYKLRKEIEQKENYDPLAIEQALLDNTLIDSFIDQAKKRYEEDVESEKRKHANKSRLANIIDGVVSSIIGSFIFVALGILVVFILHSAGISWLSSAGQQV